mgnify:CR=1 FL=1
MHPYPHTYSAAAAGNPAGLVEVTASQLPTIQSAPPPEFDGPGGVWSPETLLCAALAACFILTFRAVSRAAKLNWLHLDCRVDGVLERVERTSQFTRFSNIVNLIVSPGTDVGAARKLLEQAEHGCLIANSLRAARSLTAEVSAREA